MSLHHCVIPAAGLGTRFLPATKALPKEMIPVVDRPVIQWGVQEAVAAGADTIVMVIKDGKELIQEHFSEQPELEEVLARRGKMADLEAVRYTEHLAKFEWVYQNEPLGLGHAVLCAADVVGDNPFLCLLPDDLSHAHEPVLQQLRRAYDDLGTPILALMRVSKDQISRYGCATIAESHGNRHRIVGMVEKPPADEAASDLAIMGRYVLTPGIFDALRATTPGAGGEIQLTDGIARLLETGEIWGVEFDGALLDVGTPEGWLRTNVELASDPALLAALPKVMA